MAGNGQPIPNRVVLSRMQVLMLPNPRIRAMRAMRQASMVPWTRAAMGPVTQMQTQPTTTETLTRANTKMFRDQAPL
jgi:hypothetical protein